MSNNGNELAGALELFGEIMGVEDAAEQVPGEPCAAISPESDHVPILDKRLGEIHPSPENDRIYRPVDPTDSEIIALADSITQYGIREPLAITLDDYIVSGHRRYAAAKLAGLETVPCRVEPIRRTDDIDRFVLLLRENNRQRDKSLAEKLREEIITTDPKESYRCRTD